MPGCAAEMFVAKCGRGDNFRPTECAACARLYMADDRLSDAGCPALRDRIPQSEGSVRYALPAPAALRLHPTPAQLLLPRRVSGAPRPHSGGRPALCEPAMRCSGAVQVLAAPGSGRVEWTEAQAACVLPRSDAGRALVGLDGLAGAVGKWLMPWSGFDWQGAGRYQAGGAEVVLARLPT